MAKGLKSFSGLRNTKTRTLLLMGGLVIVVAAIVSYFVFSKPKATAVENSVAGKVPDITAIPGAATSERYQQLLEEENRRRAEAARKAGTSAVATIIGGRKKGGEESFGIEGQLLAQKECNCPQAPSATEVPTLDPAKAAALIAELKEHPERALELLKQNPGLGKALCGQDPDLALQTAEADSEAAKIILSECPSLAETLANKNPEFFKKLMLDNPDLARQLAAKNPALFKKLMQTDPVFASALAKSNPELVKTLMRSDPDFADAIAKSDPDMVKELMRNDPVFSAALAKSNPAMVKGLMLSDPEFAKTLATQNADAIKDLMATDPVFAASLAKNNPTLVKELMKNDKVFASQMGTLAPDMVKELMLNDPEFAKNMARNNPAMVNDLMRKDPNFAKALEQKNPGITAIVKGAALGPSLPVVGVAVTDADRARALELARQKERETQEALAAQRLLTEAQQKAKEELLTRMDNQAKSIFQAWNEFSPQAYVQGSFKQDQAQAAKGGTTVVVGPDGRSVAGGGQAEPPALFKAGTVLFAVLDTAINSDEPGPVMATVVEGPYQGAKLLGTMSATPQPGGQPPQKVTVNFNQINLPSRPRSLSISAVAIDPETARTAIATDVDNHYLLRYGSLLASSFLVGYAKVLTSQGTVSVNAGNGFQTTTTSQPLNNRQQIFAALGQVGQKFGEATASWFNTPPTITVDAGTGIGVLVLTDVEG